MKNSFLRYKYFTKIQGKFKLRGLSKERSLQVFKTQKTIYFLFLQSSNDKLFLLHNCYLDQYIFVV